MIQNEIQLGRIAGPFTSPPLADYVCSPIGLRPKKQAGHYRIIHDLSYPGESSVNANIPDAAKSVQYETLDHVISLLENSGTTSYMAKADILEAYRQVPIHPESYGLLGFQFQGEYYIDICLPMGLACSCAIFEEFSTAVQWILTHKLNISHVSHILDDFVFINASHHQTLSHLFAFTSLCDTVGIPLKHSKTCFPTQTMEVHGIMLDSVRMEARLPLDKLSKCKSLLTDLRQRKRVTLKVIQSVIGTLHFACKAIQQGRPFMRRICDLTRGVSQGHHHIRITLEAKRDIDCWLQFLEHFNGTSVFLSSVWFSSPSINLYTDSAGSKGYAAIFGSQWFYGPFPKIWVDHSITFKELFPIVLSLEVWGTFLQNKKVMFHTDNESCVAIINKQTSKDTHIMSLVRRLVLASLKNNIMFRAIHISGAHNLLADCLSRFQVTQAMNLAPWLNREPCVVPPHLLPPM